MTSLIRYIILAIKYEFVKKLNDETLQNILSCEWLFFATSDHGHLTNTFIKETEKIGSSVGHIANSIALIFQLIIFVSVPLFINLNVTLVTIFVFIIFAVITLKFANPISHKFGKNECRNSKCHAG